ncbi:MAG: segregation/condensation protein A [Saprospiraceae bacterium]|nr:segregation/condensation protein A [Saprospiraceae bacterium]MBK8485255.1 segregation/condensation protein A [Saprospiraceae bacterium]MBK9222471.1 segregation/condensation protein A [Saprospiraceae bacterium]MBK9720494.1 segregation/condensation protein A [Saprospiraceae bacterium]MBK9727465.1 segregation/condensation protein A [Saprospiraceae bacterium]
MNTYTIKLQQFEGPFDLLLFFIERDELEISDIPIAKITEDFLAYIRQMESMNLDLASEFILVAATLIRIKAKMLLPRKELDENNQEIDPRRELVQKLLEYKAIREVIDEMSLMEDDRYFRIPRGNIKKEFESLASKALVDAEWETLNLFNLMKVFQKVMMRFAEGPKAIVHQIYNYEYEIVDEQEKVIQKIKNYGKASFDMLFEGCENRIHAIVIFLGILELINLQQLHLLKGESMNTFWLQEKPSDESGEEE